MGVLQDMILGLLADAAPAPDEQAQVQGTLADNTVPPDPQVAVLGTLATINAAIEPGA